MRYMEDPRQTELFDAFQSILSPVAYGKLRRGWQHLFRCAILKLLPAKKLGEHFHPAMGRPTKELYSMAGLLFIMEFRDWTHEEAADAYMFNVDLQYALNLKPENQSLCRRTLERYIALFRNDELAQEIMHDVTAELVKLLDLDVSKQRLDSTHIESNMAKFGRIRLMATAARRFLVQLKRHDEQGYGQIREECSATIRSHAARHLWMEEARRRRRERTAAKRRRGSGVSRRNVPTAQFAWHSRGLSDDGQGVRAAVRSGGGTRGRPQAPGG